MNGDFLRHLTPIHRGQRLKEVLTLERIQALQDGLIFLMNGGNLTPGHGLKLGRGGDGRVRLDAKKMMPGGRAPLRPLWPRLVTRPGEGEEEEPEFFVTITKGYVLERKVTGGAECVVPHLPQGIFEEPEEGEEPEQTLKEHPITAGQWVMVTVRTLVSGAVGIKPEEPPVDPPPPPVLITIGDEESEHYEPPIGESEGSEGEPGVYHYRLAKFDGERLWPVEDVAGQHIDHWAELPTFENAGGETVWQKWDAAAGVYKTKGIEGVRQIIVEPSPDTVQVGGNKKDLLVRFIEEGSSSPLEDEDLTFEDGLSMDGAIVAGPVVRPNRDVTLPKVTAGDGISVTRAGAKNREFIVALEEAVGGGDDFDIELINGEVTEVGGEVFVSNIGWDGSEGDRRWFVRAGKIFLTNPVDGPKKKFQLICRLQGENFGIDPGNQTGDGFYPEPPPV